MDETSRKLALGWLQGDFEWLEVTFHPLRGTLLQQLCWKELQSFLRARQCHPRLRWQEEPRSHMRYGLTKVNVNGRYRRFTVPVAKGCEYILMLKTIVCPLWWIHWRKNARRINHVVLFQVLSAQIRYTRRCTCLKKKLCWATRSVHTLVVVVVVLKSSDFYIFSESKRCAPGPCQDSLRITTNNYVMTQEQSNESTFGHGSCEYKLRSFLATPLNNPSM